MSRIDEIAGHAIQSEKALEAYLTKRVEQAGGLSLKYSNPCQAGYPDRLLLMSGGKAAWCEVKSLGKKPRPLQIQRHEQLRRMGFEVYVADTREEIDNIIIQLTRTRDEEVNQTTGSGNVQDQQGRA